MRAGAWILLGLLSSCGTVVVVCDLDVFAAADVATADMGADVVQCGDVLDNPDGGAGAGWAAAQRCVLDAVAAGQRFIFTYDVPDPAYHLKGGFTGRPNESGKLIVHAFAFSAQPDDSKPSVSELTCDGDPPLIDTNSDPSTPCTPDVGQPCLTCKTNLSGVLLCGSQP